MGIRDSEIPGTFGALDSGAVKNGYAGHAHVAREIARGTNRLIAQEDPVLRLMFSADESTADSEVRGALQGFATWPYWGRIYWGPLPAPKKRQHNTLEAQVTAKIQDSETCYLQIATSAMPFNPYAALDAPNVLTMTGDGDNDFDVYSITGIPAGTSDVELVDIYISGPLTGTLASEGTYGAHNAGTLDPSSNDDGVTQSELFDASASWNTPGSTNLGTAGNYAIVFKDSDGNALVMPRRIIHVASGDSLVFTPWLQESEVRMLQHADYEIQELTSWRIADVAIYGEALT